MTQRIAWIDDLFVPAGEAAVSLEDPGFLFGFGVFTTCLIEEGRPVFFSDHCDRFQSQSRQFKLPNWSPESFLVEELFQRNQAHQGRWRLKIIQTPRHRILKLDPAEEKKESMALAVYPEPIERPLNRFKSLAYYDRFLVKEYAHEQNVDDAIVLDASRCILETSFANLLWIKGGKLHYVDPSLPYLPGIIQKHVIVAAKKEGMDVRAERNGIDVLDGACVFCCNAIQELVPVRAIEGVEVTGFDEAFVALREAFEIDKESEKTAL